MFAESVRKGYGLECLSIRVKYSESLTWYLPEKAVVIRYSFFKRKCVGKCCLGMKVLIILIIFKDEYSTIAPFYLIKKEHFLNEL